MGSKRKQPLRVVHPRCAGIDAGKAKHYVAVPESAAERAVRTFAGFTDELEAMAQWLKTCAVDTVAMEATGVYWIPVFEVLDRAGFTVYLMDARATKQVSGRKSDVLDCQWIRELMSYGLLRGAFRPPDAICRLRSYVRQRAQLVRDRSQCVQHIQKALTQMNVQLDTVLSHLMGKTGQAILRAIVAGERDGVALAKLRDRRVKADEETVARSLRGNWREEHVFALTQALRRYDFLDAQITEVQERVSAVLATLAPDRDEPLDAPPASHPHDLPGALHAMLGGDLTAIPTIGAETALTIASEIGPDLSRFPTPEHFCSWLTLAPSTRVSGGKSLKGSPTKRFNRAGQVLRLGASTARYNRTFIGASHRARLRRLDSARAIKATAHQLARLIYAMLTRGEEYVERGMAEFETQRRERQLRHLQRQARHFNLTLKPAPQAA